MTLPVTDINFSSEGIFFITHNDDYEILKVDICNISDLRLIFEMIFTEIDGIDEIYFSNDFVYSNREDHVVKCEFIEFVNKVIVWIPIVTRIQTFKLRYEFGKEL